MKNPMHDGDREWARSIAANLTLPDKKVIRINPYLNKKLEDPPNINLHALDLLSLSQLTNS